MVHKRFGAVAGTAAVGAITAAVVVGGPAATAGAAGAPTVTVDKGCYVSTTKAAQAITVSGSGFTPGDNIQLQSPDNKIYDGNPVADANGNFTAVVPAPPFYSPGHNDASETIVATDLTQQGNGSGVPPATATTQKFDYTQLDVQGPSSSTHLGTHYRFTFTGFNGGSKVYGHYIFHKKLIANVDFGRVSGACGDASFKARIYPPSSRPASGSYTVQFDNHPKYSSKTLPSYRTGFTIYHY